MAVAHRGKNVALASASTITSNSVGTDITGVVKILAMVSTSKVLGRINYAGTADA